MLKVKNSKQCLEKKYNNGPIIEIGIDEAGRGPMFGRVYCAAVVLPENSEFKYDLLKDSKKFTSENKILEVANYIQTNALFWAVSYEDEKVIDAINIRQATLNAMHKSIKEILNSYYEKNNAYDNFFSSNLWLCSFGNWTRIQVTFIGEFESKYSI